MKPRLYPLIYCLLLTALFCGCNDKEKTDPRDVATDYSVADNWLYVSSDRSKAVDVFYAYPTAYAGSDQYCAVTDAGMRPGR